MLSIDTNVIVRYLTGDHPSQSATARTLLRTTDVFVCVTVLLETEWVLRAVYGFAADRLHVALSAFAGLPRVTVEDAGSVVQALGWLQSGMDFADALHLARSGHCDAFVSFDRRFVLAAKRLGTMKVRVP